MMALPKRYETVAQLGRHLEHRRHRGRDRQTGRLPPDPPQLPTGEVRQRPPVYSAVKVGGERAYKRARRGERVEMPERIVTRAPLRAALARGPTSAIPACSGPAYEIECGSGTYVRSLIADLGGDAYCLELRRTAIGPFEVADAVAPPARGAEWVEPPLIALERRAGRALARATGLGLRL